MGNYPELTPFPNFHKIEQLVNQFWNDLKIPDQYLTLNVDSPKQFSFIDGPITANNPMGVHHAWGRSLKDIYLRFYTYQGYKARFQNGFDTQGLWVEVEVEKSLNLNSKKDIYSYGLVKFREACLERVHKYGRLITEQSKLLGQWMDWDNSYWTHTDNNIEHIWYFLKKCFSKGWLYKDQRVMPWCPRCGTSLSQHEQADSYKDLQHPSIFVSFQVKSLSATFTNLMNKALNSKTPPANVTDIHLLVWTTTPWTLPANVAVAVAPTMKYVLLKAKNSNAPKPYLVVGKFAFTNYSWLQKNFESVKEFTGKELVGTVLTGPCQDFVPKQKTIQVKVVPWKEVSEDEGTGLVHIAPGCGAEDHNLGKALALPVLAPLDENGYYVTDFGFDNIFYNEVSNQVLTKLTENDCLVYNETLTHRYPVCWRCGQELVYRLVDEWFIRTDEIRPLLLSTIEKVTFIPVRNKALMKNWLENMGDWCISRKRFWGLPLPFYECQDCGTVTVFGRIHEFRKAAGFQSETEFRDKVPDLHRPFLDDIPISCPKCHQKVYRIKEVGDCWLDAGIVPFSTLNYLQDHSQTSYWAQWFPADLVVEMREQIRLWFYSLLFMSVTLNGSAPYKVLQAYEKVYDEKGETMHRSKGNAIWWSEAYAELGADQNRWFYAQNPLEKPLLYGFNNVRESIKGFYTFWSCVRFLHQNLRLTPECWSLLEQFNADLPITNPLDAWLIEKLKEISHEVKQQYMAFHVHKVLKTLQTFWEDISRWWLRNSRKRFWKIDTKNTVEPKKLFAPYILLWNAIKLTLHWLAPVLPFTTEFLYQILVRPVSSSFPQSIHLYHWPKVTYPVLSQQYQKAVNVVPVVHEVVELVRQLRQNANIKTRYQLPQLWLINHKSKNKMGALRLWKSVLLEELNTKRLIFKRPKNNYLSLSNENWTCWLNPKISEQQRLDWYRSDVLRTVQFLRKKANLPTAKRATVLLTSDDQIFLKKVVNSIFRRQLYEEAFVNAQLSMNTKTTGTKYATRVKGLSPSIFVSLLPEDAS